MLPATRSRVAENTCEQINNRIRQKTEANIAKYADASPQVIERRLMELDNEWDVERCLETMAPSLSILGILMGIGSSKKWLALPLIVQGFFLQHALQGWCPPLVALRHLGIRTSAEIEQERYALKGMRGDFHNVDERRGRVNKAIAAVAS